MRMKSLASVGALALAAIWNVADAQAQAYPARSVQVIVPFAGGSASDVLTRVVLERMGNAMGRRFVVENRPGAGGAIGAAQVAPSARRRWRRRRPTATR